MNTLDQMFAETQNIQDLTQAATKYAEAYGQYLGKVIQKLDFKAIGKFAELLWSTRAKNKKIYFIGNGGSAATASHFANDLQIGPTPLTKNSFKAIALTDNNAIMTCIANDFGYEEVFRRQLEVLLEPGDVVVAISASGNSPNVIKAVEWAKAKGNFIVGITGFDGGKLKQVSDLNINVETPKGEYGPVEDVHMILDHLVSTCLMRKIKQTE